MEKNFQELNDQQQQAVYEEHSKICVIAGPGCGKTKTLISRIIYLLTNKNIKPESILVLTFAKKAIKEIKKRISACSTVNNISPQKLYIYNFHSFCFRVLSKHSYLLGFPENKFPVYGRYEQETIISKILCKDGIDAETKEISAIIFFINNWKLGKLNYDDLKSDNSAKKRYKIYQKYEEYLKTNHALDFNDLLLYTASLFKSFPQVREEYQKQFSYFLLDEFQDINSIQ